MQQTLSENGINWQHFHEAIIDEQNKTVQIIKSWRSHKFENRGPAWPASHTPVEIIRNSCNITAWRESGKPGGIDGLKTNFRQPSRVLFHGNTAYTLIP